MPAEKMAVDGPEQVRPGRAVLAGCGCTAPVCLSPAAKF